MTVITIPSAGNGKTIKNLLTRRVGNLPIHVPTMDWEHVLVGEKRMFRCYSHQGGNRETPVVPVDTKVPRPCLLYATRHTAPKRSREYAITPGVLLSHRQEPLGSISPADLTEEGFEFLPAFRFYWQQRHRKLGWRPWDLVSVIEVRPATGSDERWLGAWAFEQLYGEWL